MKQFCWNARNTDKKKSFLAVQEIEEAETLLFKWIQHEEFGTDLLAMTQNQPLSKKSKLLRLTPFLHERGITRIGGRLSKAEIQSSAKHHLILPVKHHVVQRLIRQYHEISLFGTGYVLSNMCYVLSGYVLEIVIAIKFYSSLIRTDVYIQCLIHHFQVCFELSLSYRTANH